MTTDVVYGHKDGLALTFDVHRPAQSSGAGVIAIVSGGYQSSVEMSRLIVDGYLSPLLNEKGFTVFAVRHGSSPTYPMSAIVSDVRRAVRFIRQHAGEYMVAAASPLHFVGSPAAEPGRSAAVRPRRSTARCAPKGGLL